MSAGQGLQLALPVRLRAYAGRAQVTVVCPQANVCGAPLEDSGAARLCDNASEGAAEAFPLGFRSSKGRSGLRYAESRCGGFKGRWNARPGVKSTVRECLCTQQAHRLLGPRKAENSYDSFEVVRQHAQAHFRRHVLDPSHQEVRPTHPVLEGSKDMSMRILRTVIASGIRSSLCWALSINYPSCSQRLMRR